MIDQLIQPLCYQHLAELIINFRARLQVLKPVIYLTSTYLSIYPSAFHLRLSDSEVSVCGCRPSSEVRGGSGCLSCADSDARKLFQFHFSKSPPALQDYQYRPYGPETS